uniref:Uncharacterized protein n=1 Tax=Magallana gigas TaxID=29159 RepID=K1PU65_MAGGI
MLERVFSDPMKSGEKGKEQDNPKLASTSKTPTQNSESDIKSWCLSSAEKSDKPIFERLAKVDVYEPKEDFLVNKLRTLPMFHDKEYADHHFVGDEEDFLVMPQRLRDYDSREWESNEFE